MGGQTRLAGPEREVAAADERDDRGLMMRRTKWWHARTALPLGGPRPRCRMHVGTPSTPLPIVRGGSRLGSRSANIVLPEPGGPISNRWCRPAAATSRARRPTADRGRRRDRDLVVMQPRAPVSGRLAKAICRRKIDTSSASVPTPCTLAPRTSAASWTSQSGTTSNGDDAGICQGDHPRDVPQRAIETELATKGQCLRCSRGRVARWPRGIRSAMGRSSPAPAFRTPEGARLTVTRCIGHCRPLDRTAARTLIPRLPNGGIRAARRW